MSRFAEMILPEFDQEMANTRKVLECIPDDKLDWQAHADMHTIGWNANHLAETAGWVAGTLTQTEWDIAPVDGEAYQSPTLTTTKEIVALFDQNVAEARSAIEAVQDEDMGVMWSLLQGGKPMMTMPRAAVIRGFVLSHTIHHRAHLCVYLRLNDIAVPAMYGGG